MELLKIQIHQYFRALSAGNIATSIISRIIASFTCSNPIFCSGLVGSDDIGIGVRIKISVGGFEL